MYNVSLFKCLYDSLSFFRVLEYFLKGYRHDPLFNLVYTEILNLSLSYNGLLPRCCLLANHYLRKVFVDICMPRNIGRNTKGKSMQSSLCH